MGSKERFYVDVMTLHPEVTGSCILCIVKFPNGDLVRFVVDCGLFQEREHEGLNYVLPFNTDNIDFVLVTHNHVDHTGRLPFLVKNGFRNKIFTTCSTKKLLPLALSDACKVLKDVSKRQNQVCLYNESDVDITLDLVEDCDYNITKQITDDIKVTFFNNGHLMGAAVILVQISYPGYDDINLLFTGDYNNKNIFFKVNQIPEWVLELPLTIVQESTYGDKESTEIQKCFRSNIIKCLNNEGTALVLVFSLGRAQECLYELKCMQESEDLDINIPIFLDGNLAIKYTNLYINDGLDIDDSMRDFLPSNLTFVNKENRDKLLSDTDKKIILTTSGMGSYGPAQVYIPEYIRRKKTLIQFTGYTAEGTLGNRLKIANVDDVVTVGGLLVKKQADVEYSTEFSAHAKADEMIEFLNQFKNLKLILVNHGETQTKETFAKRIVEQVKAKAVGILGREYFFRINPYGLVKTLSTKFK